MIEVQGISKSYGPVQAVRDVSFSIGSGEIVGLLGPNGAGKTTIMKILTCYHYPSEGSAKVNGFDVLTEPFEVRSAIGYLPENAPLYHDLTVREYLEFIADTRGLKGEYRAKRLETVIAECGIAGVYEKPISDLSKGYRQRVGLAQAIVHDPAILILDEPTNGLDPNQILEIRSLITRLGKEKTVILSTHILQEVEAICNRVLILSGGSIAAEGTTQEIGRKMKGQTLIDIKLVPGKDLTVPVLRAGLSSLSGVQSVEILDVPKSDILSATVSFGPEITGNDPSIMLFDWAVAGGHKIISMNPRQYRLEDIFISVTREGGSSNEPAAAL